MPSVLAIRDLRRRLRHRFQGQAIGPEQLATLLRLDPLAWLRGWRAAAAPIYGATALQPTSAALVQHLGPTLGRRLFDVAAVDVAGTSPIRRLWLHAIATACAARNLAAASGLLAPEAAYCLGLLHDLPQWLDLLHRRQAGAAPSQDAAQWAGHWLLPPDWIPVLTNRAAALDRDCLSTATTLVTAAELLAELADFGHPHADPAAAATLAAVGKEELMQARELRREVEAELRSVGLDFALPEFDATQVDASELGEGGLFSASNRGSLEEVVGNLLGCSRSESYRGLVTAITGAAVRFGGYDRACYARWQPGSNTVVLRSKADMSARRLTTARLQLLPAEAAALRRSTGEERPVRIEGQLGETSGLLAALGCDELLAIVLNRDLATPSVLLLDRSLSLQPIQIVDDATAATTLAQLGSLLNQNLLLRRRRQRADQVALSDPLTRLNNRRGGLQILAQEVLRANRTGQALTVLLCDLDHFKRLNDQHGHLQGDLALRATAAVMRATLRRTDAICRYGGEEFLVVLPDTAPEDAAVLAARLFTATANRGQELQLPLTISIGLTALRPGDRVEDLLHRADQALYASKGHGRNRFSVDVETGEEPVHNSPKPA